MKKKELRNLAAKIAKCERVLRSSSDNDEIKRTEFEIIKICSSVDNYEDMTIIDEMVQELLEKN